MHDPMNDETTRLDMALSAMKHPGNVSRDAAARVAARAVLANAPMQRVQRWAFRAAALVMVAGGSAVIGTNLLRNPADGSGQLASTEATLLAEAADAVALTPVVATRSRPIVFELDAPSAQSVQVLGDFNQWSRSANAMRRGSDGHWRQTTLLPPGRYVYAYLVDGRVFQRDPARDAVEDRDFGVTGSELVVSEAP
jgi:hypothetical protein